MQDLSVGCPLVDSACVGPGSIIGCSIPVSRVNSQAHLIRLRLGAIYSHLLSHFLRAVWVRGVGRVTLVAVAKKSWIARAGGALASLERIIDHRVNGEYCSPPTLLFPNGGSLLLLAIIFSSLASLTDKNNKSLIARFPSTVAQNSDCRYRLDASCKLVRLAP